jgi:3-oxoacyl-[acyl-carrier-protein] synthase II
MPDSKRRRFDPAIKFGIGAALQALKDSGLDLTRVDPDRIGVVDGTSVCGLTHMLEAQTRFLSSGYKGIQPSRTVTAFAGACSSEIAIALGITHSAVTIATACSSGNDALAWGASKIADGSADVMIAGAEEAPIVEAYYSLFTNVGVLSRRNHEPGKAMRPFDEDRDGFVLGEGSAFVILEELAHALARGARIYCEFSGHGQSCDAYSSVSNHPEGKGMKRAIERALFDAEIPLDEVDYINCHGSATEVNEIVETKVYRSVFGRWAERLQISATKPVTGHLMGATAAVEAVICAMALFDKTVPPTANLEKPADGCDLDYVRGAARRLPLRRAMNVNLGFGGKNSALILSAFDGA